MSSYETLFKVSANLAGADEGINTIRLFDNHANCFIKIIITILKPLHPEELLQLSD